MSEQPAEAPAVKTDSERIADLEAALAASRAAAPEGTTVQHGGGVGNVFEETWSQHDQELASRGEHPLQD
jgi:hypothetical protein